MRRCLHSVAAALLCVATGWAQAQTRIDTVDFGSRTPPSAALWTPRHIEVFATTSMYVQNADGATVHRVDGRRQLMAELNRGGLPPDRQQAEALLRQRMRAMGPELNRKVQAAALAVERSLQMGVSRVPAVIFDGSKVVYGTADVAQAIDIARRGGAQPIRARFTSGRTTRGTP